VGSGEVKVFGEQEGKVRTNRLQQKCGQGVNGVETGLKTCLRSSIN
jgi:hypothetical protein